MGLPRLAAASALTLLLAGLAAWLLADAGTEGADGTFPVTVVGPDGVLLEATVEDTDATALSVLLVAAGDAGIDVHVDDGGACMAYVFGIGPHRAQGSSGWLYHVGHGGDWEVPRVSAECRGLAPGEAVRWVWTDGSDGGGGQAEPTDAF